MNNVKFFLPFLFKKEKIITQKDILKSNNYCLIDRTTAESLFPESKKPLPRI